MIKLIDVKKSYGQGGSKIEVLKGVSLEIKQGETVALLGKSGSGKSTLLSLMAGLDDVDSGEVWLSDKCLNHLSQKELTLFRAQKIGIVFQQFHLISSLSALENVLLPLNLLKTPQASKRAWELLDQVGLHSRAQHLPNELSGGESQRVAIARALSIAPSVLFADEPSGNLDEETGQMVMDLLFNLVQAAGTTMVLVTHDRDLAHRCSRIIHLEHGGVV